MICQIKSVIMFRFSSVQTSSLLWINFVNNPVRSYVWADILENVKTRRFVVRANLNLVFASFSCLLFYPPLFISCTVFFCVYLFCSFKNHQGFLGSTSNIESRFKLSFLCNQKSFIYGKSVPVLFFNLYTFLDTLRFPTNHRGEKDALIMCASFPFCIRC